MNRNVAIVTGVGLGVGLMYILDPTAGRRRRAVMRDKAFSFWRRGASALDKASRDITNRTKGVMSEMGSKTAGEVDDSRLEARVRSRMGRVVSHPSAITVNAQSGRIALSGDVLKSELAGLLNAVANVPGVMTTENSLNIHETAENVASLQGAESPGFSLRPSTWSPTTWAVIGAAGSGLGAYCGIRYAVNSRRSTPWWRRALNVDWRGMLDRVDWRGALDHVEIPSYDFSRLIRWSPEMRILAGATGGTMGYYLTRAIWNRRTPRSRWQRMMSSMPTMNSVAERLQIPSWPRVPRAVAHQVNRWVH